ncbi:MAG: M28 family peptidase, partial [Brevundimonas sp.]
AKAAEAYRRGAVGVLTLVNAAADAAAWTRRAQFNDRRRTLSPGNDDLEFTGAVLGAAFAQWAEAAGLRAEDVTAGLDGGDFRAVALEGVTLDVDAEETVETQRSWNLLARIPGTERPEETIVFSAHWDHVGVREGGEGDHIYNGAWDNASGTVGLVEMARELKAAGPFERSIVFLHVTAEEQGLLGAFWYAAHPVYPLETTVANINIDMLPLSAPTRDLPIFGLGQNTLEDELGVLAEAEGRYVSDDGQPEQGFYYRSDHFAFARAGVPALMPWHGVDLDEGGREVGLPAYQAKFRSDYHQPSDEWSADLDFSSAVENLTLLHRLTVDLADSERWPSWKPTSEFGAVRARSAARRE